MIRNSIQSMSCSPTRSRSALLMVALALLIGGCAEVQLGREKAPDQQNRPEHWRKAAERDQGEGPGGVVSALTRGGLGTRIDPGGSPSMFYRSQYTLWTKDHKNFKRVLGRNGAGTQELARQVTGSLEGMKEMLEREEQRNELAASQARYERIAKRSTEGISPTSFSLALDKLWRRISKVCTPPSRSCCC